MDKLAILHPVSECPGCGWPSLSNSRGRMLCCEKVHVGDIPKIKARRCRNLKLRSDFSGARPEGGDHPLKVPSPTLPGGQLELWK